MITKLVTCPETGHLERIELEAHPLGILIASCTRFCPAGRVGCSRTCARRMDERDRAAAHPSRP